jgi:hypothetical protein
MTQPDGGLPAEELELLARYDGTERIAALASARLIMLAPANATDDPVAVTIQWASGAMERPLPGSALWRATLWRHLAMAGPDDPTTDVVRRQIRRSLERFPDLESWWHWVRTGWTAPPRL